MRLLPALFLAITLSAAQPGVPAGAPIASQTNALGGHYGAGAMGRPLGGINRPAPPRRRGAGPVYGTVWYAPSYFDSSSYPPEPAPPVDAEAPPPPPPPPVIINQYFAAPPSQAPPQQEPQQASVEPKYFLLAYKDHSIYSVLAYWVEDKTMHYVTTNNTHNQASVDLIDMDLTKTLNKDH
jgi:hypothetical protein